MLQGNATGAMLHKQYMQSLFAAAVDGLLRSPASLLGIASSGSVAAEGTATAAATAEPISKAAGGATAGNAQTPPTGPQDGPSRDGSVPQSQLTQVGC